jgi:Skp family chaperone for outer membrane proteins
MTGLECLKEEMMRRGCTKSQAESKTTAVVLEILANGGTIYTDLMEAEKRTEHVKREYANYYAALNNTKRELETVENELQAEKVKLSKRQEATLEYMKAFERRLMECETPEGRDTLRTAQFFMNTVNLHTPQNNTAFIYGLSLILAGKVIDGEPLRPVEIK